MTGGARPAAEPPFVRDPTFLRVKQKIVDTTGLDYYSDRDEALAGQIRRLSGAHGMDEAAYCRWLLGADGETPLAELTNEIAIGETYFFRYPQQLDALRNAIIPECLTRARASRRLSVWCAGCASGAEPYTLSILLRSAFAAELAGWRISILGTDINRRALDQARAAVYGNWELRTADDEQKQRFFEPAGDRWRLRPPYRMDVEFAYQNLASDLAPFVRGHAQAFDLIFCRNVMIYFAPPLMRRMLRAFDQCLAPGGWLLVGHAEPYFEIANVLAPVSVGDITVYRRADDAVDGRLPMAMPAAPAWEPLPLPPLPAEPQPPARQLPGPPVRPAPAESGVDAALSEVRVLAEAGDWPAALGACERLVTRFPLSAAGHYTCALVAEHAGAAGRAETALKRALYLDRGFALAHYHLGRCQLRRGAHADAARSFANADRAILGAADGDALPLGEGITAGDLRELIAIHAGILGETQP